MEGCYARRNCVILATWPRPPRASRYSALLAPVPRLPRLARVKECPLRELVATYMPRRNALIWLLFALYIPAGAGILPSAVADVTVVLDFRGPNSVATTKEMQREASQILGASGVHLSFATRQQAAASDFSDLVVMTFRGNCKAEPPMPRYDETGPYAVTWTTDGRVLPFGEVDCPRVLQSARSAMWGGDLARSEMFYGRALGRVVAHELVHMLTRSGDHARNGVQREALSARDLTGASLTLSKEDLNRLKAFYTPR